MVYWGLYSVRTCAGRACAGAAGVGQVQPGLLGGIEDVLIICDLHSMTPDNGAFMSNPDAGCSLHCELGWQVRSFMHAGSGMAHAGIQAA